MHQGTQFQKWQTDVGHSSCNIQRNAKSKEDKLSLLTRKYELFFVEENKDIQCMFKLFQTILNELRPLGRTYDNYDHINKILRSLSRKWRSQVTSPRALMNLDSVSLKELVGTLKVHEQELQ